MIILSLAIRYRRNIALLLLIGIFKISILKRYEVYIPYTFNILTWICLVTFF